LQISYDEKGCPIPSVGFDYDSIDGIEEEEETLEKQCLTDVLYFINGNGSIEDIERRSIFFLNIIKKDLRPSLRISLTGYIIPEWKDSPIASRIADYLSQCRYKHDLLLRSVILLFNFGAYLLEKECDTQLDIAEWLGLSKGAVSKCQKKLETFFQCPTIHSNKKKDSFAG
jgi:hypothetical protein